MKKSKINKRTKKVPPSLDSLMDQVKTSMGDDFYSKLQTAVDSEKSESYSNGMEHHKSRIFYE